MADWEANVRRVVPYTPGEQPKRNDIIKLNTNECPYPPAPGVTKALQEFEADKLRLYPDCSVDYWHAQDTRQYYCEDNNCIRRSG